MMMSKDHGWNDTDGGDGSTAKRAGPSGTVSTNLTWSDQGRRLKDQSVQRSKHSPSRLCKPVI